MSPKPMSAAWNVRLRITCSLGMKRGFRASWSFRVVLEPRLGEGQRSRLGMRGDFDRLHRPGWPRCAGKDSKAFMKQALSGARRRGRVRSDGKTRESRASVQRVLYGLQAITAVSSRCGLQHVIEAADFQANAVRHTADRTHRDGLGHLDLHLSGRCAVQFLEAQPPVPR
jgi:hypothetical protein